MHRDLKEEVQVRFKGDFKLYQAELDVWRKEFNDVRPHEALDMKTPSEIYVKSKRKYYDDEPEIDYPDEYQIRKVTKDGQIKVYNDYYFITTALHGYHVGLKVADSDKFDVYFSDLMLGTLNLKTISFKAV